MNLIPRLAAAVAFGYMALQLQDSDTQCVFILLALLAITWDGRHREV